MKMYYIIHNYTNNEIKTIVEKHLYLKKNNIYSKKKKEIR